MELSQRRKPSPLFSRKDYISPNQTQEFLLRTSELEFIINRENEIKFKRKNATAREIMANLDEPYQDLEEEIQIIGCYDKKTNTITTKLQEGTYLIMQTQNEIGFIKYPFAVYEINPIHIKDVEENRRPHFIYYLHLNPELTKEQREENMRSAFESTSRVAKENMRSTFESTSRVAKLFEDMKNN